LKAYHDGRRARVAFRGTKVIGPSFDLESGSIPAMPYHTWFAGSMGHKHWISSTRVVGLLETCLGYRWFE
jgi:hypothetical protein